ncbi:MAG: polysaccharide biosynthesis C-terminal domain-containing protein, partial [Mailhella sp.]|nr:polysaccharide biosynthesis C-terminal domain-containing protein [Mailhella sp.]
MSSKSTRVDMLNGSLVDKIVMFALPLAATSVLQQLFNAADLAVVGRFASSTAMAAVGSNSSLISLLLSLFMGLSLGSNVLIASMIGRGQREEINAAVHSTIGISLACGMIVFVLGMFLAKPLLMLMSAPQDVIDLAALYLRIYFFAVPFIMVYNFGSAILRSKGDSKRPLIAMTIGGVLNVLLNLLLVVVFHLHVIGVAVATVASNVISAAMVWFFLAR